MGHRAAEEGRMSKALLFLSYNLRERSRTLKSCIHELERGVAQRTRLVKEIWAVRQRLP